MRSGQGWCHHMSPCHCPATPGPTSQPSLKCENKMRNFCYAPNAVCDSVDDYRRHVICCEWWDLLFTLPLVFLSSIFTPGNTICFCTDLGEYLQFIYSKQTIDKPLQALYGKLPLALGGLLKGIESFMYVMITNGGELSFKTRSVTVQVTHLY